MKLEFDLDTDGNQVLSGRLFENATFSHLELLPAMGSKIRIENCQFLRCATSPGTCIISSGVTLDDVVLSDLDCGDALRISSEAELNKVVIKGERPKALIVQPENEAGSLVPESKQVEFHLDISQFFGDVTIVGIRGMLVRKDAHRHVTVHARWKDELDWKRLGIGPFSYWKIFVKKLSVFHVEEGVFSLPDSSNKHYAETMREREALENAGIRFV